MAKNQEKQSDQSDESVGEKMSETWSEIMTEATVETYVDSFNVSKEQRGKVVRGVSVNTHDCDGTLTITDGKRALTARITSDQLRALADVQDRAVALAKKVEENYQKELNEVNKQ